MKAPDEKPSITGLRLYGFVSRLREDGATAAEIQSKLIGEGLDPQEAKALVDRLLARETKEEIRARAARWLRQGTRAEDVEANLAEQGYDPQVIAEEIKQLVAEWAREEMARNDDPRPAWRLLGILLLILGGALYIGNRTGVFVTFSYSGAITMGIGAIVFAMGQYQDSSR